MRAKAPERALPDNRASGHFQRGLSSAKSGDKHVFASLRWCQSPFFAGVPMRREAENRDCHSLAVPLSATSPAFGVFTQPGRRD